MLWHVRLDQGKGPEKRRHCCMYECKSGKRIPPARLPFERQTDITGAFKLLIEHWNISYCSSRNIHDAMAWSGRVPYEWSAWKYTKTLPLKV